MSVSSSAWYRSCGIGGHIYWGAFVVKMDHYSLKFLLDQRLSTIPQHQWATKLLGFEFTVEYKPCSSNVVADALSRQDSETKGSLLSLMAPTFQVFDDLQQELDVDPAVQKLRGEAQAGKHDGKWKVVDGLLTVVGHVYGTTSCVHVQMHLVAAHNAGHEGMEKTLHRLHADFYIPGSHMEVRKFIRAYAICQRNKVEHLHPVGLLQPLELSPVVWEDVVMDFIEGLPQFNGKSVILMVVDRFSKSTHFLPLGHPYTTTTIVRCFFDNVVRLHGIQASIVSDRNPVFTSNFWRELFKLTGVKLNMTSVFHPQSDGSQKPRTRLSTMCLCRVTDDCPRHWMQWLPWAEFCYNSSYQASLHTSPFHVVYGQDPPSIRSYA
jgi:hypothetical protein